MFRNQRSAWVCFGLLACTLAFGSACTPIPPVNKVGIIAPFEGLYRETGYAALDAVRLAISDCTPADANLVPLALDDSAQPSVASRTARKLLADPAVIAIIGPYDLSTLDAVMPRVAQEGPVWITPAALTAEGRFAEIDDDLGWLSDLTVQIVRLAANEGASSVTVGGLPTAWIPSVVSDVSDSSVDIPISLVSEEVDLAALEPSAALIWMGQPHVAARLSNELDSLRSPADLWMGPEAGASVFAALNNSSGTRYWVSWVSPTYNLGVEPAPGALTSDLTYAATCHALGEVYGRAEVDTPSFRLQVFRTETDGTSNPIGAP